MSPAMQEFRELMKAEDSFVRAIMAEVLREQVTEAVRDNVLGAGEILTGMLPQVLAGLMSDLQSKDWVIRSRAQAAVLKYAMVFKDKEGVDEDLGTINVVHKVALPNTPLGYATEKAIEVIEAGHEEFEADWPQCSKCEERKHPDAIKKNGNSLYCSTCLLTMNYKRTTSSDPGGFLKNDPEFGGDV